MIRALRITGQTLVNLVAVVLILAGTLKLLNVGADDMVEGLKHANLDQYVTLISVTAIACGVLLIVPRTRQIGILAASAYWGGAIVAHLTYDDSILMPSVFQGMLWIGTMLTEFTSKSSSNATTTKHGPTE